MEVRLQAADIYVLERRSVRYFTYCAISVPGYTE